MKAVLGDLYAHDPFAMHRVRTPGNDARGIFMCSDSSVIAQWWFSQ